MLVPRYIGTTAVNHVCRLQASPKLQEETNLRVFVLLLTTHYYDAVAAAFVPVPDMPTTLPAQLRDAKQALRAVDAGQLCIQHNLLLGCKPPASLSTQLNRRLLLPATMDVLRSITAGCTPHPRSDHIMWTYLQYTISKCSHVQL